MFYGFQKCSFEHIKRKCEHLLGQPHSLAAFFIQLMIVFSFCQQLVEDISVHHVNYCFFNKLTLCSESRCSTLADRTNRLPYSYPEDDVTGRLDVTYCS